MVVFGTGDTVNTASRMESNSEALRINCSEAAAKLVMVQDPSLLLIPRGAINVKGKAKMNTFWVQASNSSKDASNAGIYLLDLLTSTRSVLPLKSPLLPLPDARARAGPSFSLTLSIC